MACALSRWNAVYISVYIQAVCNSRNTNKAANALMLETASPLSSHTNGSKARAPTPICSMAICAGAMCLKR